MMLRVLSVTWVGARPPKSRRSGPPLNSQPWAAKTTRVSASTVGQGGVPGRRWGRLSLGFVSTNMKLPSSIWQAADST